MLDGSRGAGAAKGISALGTAGKVSQVTRFKLVSRIKENNTLVKQARAAGKSPELQRDIDDLVKALTEGNFSKGKGSRHLFGNVCEMRSNLGARVYYRRTGDTIEILAKSEKGNQDEAIRLLRRLYQQ